MEGYSGEWRNVGYKGHPALLIWGVGNEMELGPPEAELDPNIWRAVDEVARMIKREDPNHPTMTVITRDPDGDRLQIRWEVRRESPALTGPPPPVVADSEKQIHATQKAGPETDFLDRPIPYSSATGRAVFQVPQEEGPYRLFVYVLDNRGSAATANVPFLVKASPQLAGKLQYLREKRTDILGL